MIFLCCLSLQPLKDNLESQTYEVFEKDPIKYSQYQKVSRNKNSLTAEATGDHFFTEKRASFQSELAFSFTTVCRKLASF